MSLHATHELQAELRYAKAINRIARIITHDSDLEQIRGAMAEIIGETLDVDRTLIYDVRFDEHVAEGLCEWLNPAAVGVEPTIATYPLDVFIGGATYIRATQSQLQSHADSPHPVLLEDGSAEVLHQAMSIKSLLWFPFDFEEQRLFMLVFNQVRAHRQWSDVDVGFVEDVAELVSMAHLRARLEGERRAQQLRDEQHTRLEGLGLLAGGVAHDFNNLLTAILGNVELIRVQTGPDSPSAPHIANVGSAVASGAAMCRQLLAYAGHEALGTERIDACELIADTVYLLEPTVVSAVNLELASVPIWVQGDRSQLQQVFLNLLTNAFEALPDGRGRITVRSGVIGREQAGVELADWREGDRAFISVEDTGKGMSTAEARRVFEPFFTTKKTGHGLGLAAAHGVLRSLNAAIGVRSELRCGSTFTIVFSDPATPSMPPAASGVESPWVLVVDDEVLVRDVCASSLKLGGYRVRVAGSGEQALVLCAEHGTEIAAMVLDVGLPGLDGRQTFVKLRERGHRFPVVFVSAHPIGSAFEGADLDGWTFLAKPFRPETLLETVGRMVQEVRR